MIANLEVQTALNNKGNTYLAKGYYTPPFKLATISRPTEVALKVMLMSASPGMLDGDVYRLYFNLQKNTSLHISTQSYQRFFHMQKGAIQTMQVLMDEGATFCYLPHPAVPHAGAHVTIQNKIQLTKGCTLVWGEVLTPGRTLNGELFQYRHYSNSTQVFYNNRLIVYENIILEPGMADYKTIGNMEGYTHQGSLLFINDNINVPHTLQKAKEHLKPLQHVAFGVSQLPCNGIVVRLLGHKAEQLHRCLTTLAHSLLQTTAQSVNYVF